MMIDDQQRRHLEELLRKHWANLRHLEKQAAEFGGMHVPLPLQNSITHEKDEIAHIETELGRDTSTTDRADLEQLRQQGRKAYFRKDWVQAVELLAQVAAHDSGDDDVRAKL